MLKFQIDLLVQYVKSQYAKINKTVIYEKLIYENSCSYGQNWFIKNCKVWKTASSNGALDCANHATREIEVFIFFLTETGTCWTFHFANIKLSY